MNAEPDSEWLHEVALRKRAEAELCAPGAPFELTTELVRGQELCVFKQRLPHLIALLERSQAFGELPYLVFPSLTLSFREHFERVSDLAASFHQDFGVGPGDRVAIWGANAPEWCLAFWASIKLGAVAVAMNGWWAPDEFRYALAHCAPKLLVADAKRLARVEGAPAVPVLEFGAPTAAFGTAPPKQIWQAISRGGELRGRGRGELAVTPNEDDPAILLYTSGTTGRPKGALHSHRNVLGLLSIQAFHGARLALMARYRTEPPQADDKAIALAPPASTPPQHCRLVTNPLFHVSGLHASLIAHLAGGVRSVWTTGRFSAEAVLSTIERERVNGWGPQGSMAYRVLHHPERQQYDLTSVTSIGCGGAPVTPEIQAELRDAFPNAASGLAVGYGLTEGTALACLNFGAELARFPESVGAPLPTVELQIRGPSGQPLPDGEVGEIHLRSPLVMLGYFGDQRATQQAIDAHGWLRTGDVGQLLDGRLYIHTRGRDLILRAAENVYPAEIERRLEQHPQVAECAVLGAPHPELGQEVMAVIVPRSAAPVDFEQLSAWVAEALAYYKVPSRWLVRSEPLPRNASGKVMKVALLGAEGEADWTRR